MINLRQVFFGTILLSTVLAGCKSQKQLSSSQSNPVPAQDSLQSVVEEVDTIPVIIEPLADSVKNAKIDTVQIIVEKKDSIVLTGVGDMMLGTNFPEQHYLPPNQGKDMLAGVSQIFEGADIVFGNLEGVILDSGGTQKNCNNPKACYLFRSPDYMGNRIQEAGFNLMSVANNHAGDFGPEGRANTAKVLDSLGIAWAGNTDKPWTIFDKDGVRYGFAAFSPNKGTPSINHLAEAKRIIAHLDSLTDIIIVSFHGGAEGSKYTAVPREHEYFYGEDRGDVYHFAHALIDAGADVIFGHGPHVPRAIEVYKKRFIAYSLGNFATYARFNLRGVNGLAPIAKITVNSEG